MGRKGDYAFATEELKINSANLEGTLLPHQINPAHGGGTCGGVCAPPPRPPIHEKSPGAFIPQHTHTRQQGKSTHLARFTWCAGEDLLSWRRLAALLVWWVRRWRSVEVR